MPANGSYLSSLFAREEWISLLADVENLMFIIVLLPRQGEALWQFYRPFLEGQARESVAKARAHAEALDKRVGPFWR